MLRQIVIGICAGVVAIIVMTLARPESPPRLSLGPDVVKVEDIDAFLRRSVNGAGNPSGPPVDLDRVVEHVEFENTPFRDVMAWLREAVGVDVIVNWKALDAVSVPADTPITLSADKLRVAVILQMILLQTGSSAAYRVDRGIVYVSSEEMLDAIRVVRVYNVRDLMVHAVRFGIAQKALAQGKAAATLPVEPPWPARRGRGWYQPELPAEERGAYELMAAVHNAADPENREDGSGWVPVTYWAGKLVVSATRTQHERIEKVLNDLRASDQ